MKATTSFNKRTEEETVDTTDSKHKSAPVDRSTTHSENGDISDAEKKKSAPLNLSNGEVPSFMKPTKSFESRDRHNEESMVHQTEPVEPEKKSVRKPRASITEGDLPSYMKTTKSHELREQAIATGVVDTSSLERALEGPMIDDFTDSAATTAKTRKTSVGGFLRKKFGLGKGEIIVILLRVLET